MRRSKVSTGTLLGIFISAVVGASSTAQAQYTSRARIDSLAEALRAAQARLDALEQKVGEAVIGTGGDLTPRVGLLGDLDNRCATVGFGLGIRGVGLLDTGEGLERAFADVTGLATQCRFGDCSHDGEPGCAVEAALADGSLLPRRLESWRKLHREVAVESGRRAARLAGTAGPGRRRPRR